MSEKLDIRCFDILVDNKNVEEEILSILYELRPGWKDRGIHAEAFTGGYINSMICFNLKEDEKRKDALVVRVHGTGFEDFRLDRENELLVMQLAHAAGCFPPVYASFNNGMVYKYAPGRTLTYKDLTDPTIIKEITRMLYNFHHVDVDSVRLVNHRGEEVSFDKTQKTFEQVEGMLKRIPFHALNEAHEMEFLAHRKELTDEVLKREYHFIKDILDEVQFPMTLIHDDFQLRNIILDDETGDVNLIDYEMARIGYESQDLARLFEFKPILEECGFLAPGGPDFTEEHRQMWLRGYLDAKCQSLGKKTDEVPEAERELMDVEHRILQIIANYVSIILILVCFVKMEIELDCLKCLPSLKRKYFSEKDELLGLKTRYIELKKHVSRFN